MMGIPFTAQSFHDSHDDTYAPSGRHLVGRRIQISVSAQGDDDERGERVTSRSMVSAALSTKSRAAARAANETGENKK